MKACFQLHLVFLRRLTPQLEDSANVARIRTVCDRSKDDDFESRRQDNANRRFMCILGTRCGGREFCKIVCANSRVAASVCWSNEKVALRTKLCYTFATNHNPHEIADTHAHTYTRMDRLSLCRLSATLAEQLLNYYA